MLDGSLGAAVHHPVAGHNRPELRKIPPER